MTVGLSREMIAVRAGNELIERRYLNLPPGRLIVNLGFGLPAQICSYVPADAPIFFHSENGCLGYGPLAAEDEQDPDTINGGSLMVTLQPWASFVTSADAFAMIRSGRVDVVVLGGLEVAANGDLANWKVPGRKSGGVGGAVDLCVGCKRVIVAMEHRTKRGEPRLVERCRYDLTGAGCVDLVITDLAVVQLTPDGFLLREVAPGVSVDEVKAATGASLAVAEDVREMAL